MWFDWGCGEGAWAALRYSVGRDAEVRGSTSPFEIILTTDERRELERRAGAYTAPYCKVARAKIILLAAEGVVNSEIAARLDTSPQVVHRWRRRFFEQRLEGLEDRKRSGRPRVFSGSSR